MSKEIPLSNGGFALIDDDDFDFISQWKWKKHTQGYASRTGWDRVNQKWIAILMHRLINKTPDGLETDHINGDKLDNRKVNLQTIVPLDHRMKHLQPLLDSAAERKIYPDYKNCIVCGKEFKAQPHKQKRQQTCSPACARKLSTQKMSETRGYGVLSQRKQGKCLACDSEAIAQNYCPKHYKRFKKYGDPHLTKQHGSTEVIQAND